MKNVLKMGLVLIALTFTKCQKSNEVQEKVLLSPEVIGKLHNTVMTNFKENYVPKEGLSENKTIEDIILFNINFIDSEVFTIKDESSNEKEIIQLKSLFDTKELIECSFYNDYSKRDNIIDEGSKSNSGNTIEMVEYLFNNSIISLSEKEILDQSSQQVV